MVISTFKVICNFSVICEITSGITNISKFLKILISLVIILKMFLLWKIVNKAGFALAFSKRLLRTYFVPGTKKNTNKSQILSYLNSTQIPGVVVGKVLARKHTFKIKISI